MTPHIQAGEHIFGIPLTLTDAEASELRVVLSQVWEFAYGEAPAEKEHDIARCRDFFDPAARGFKLRERLTALPEVPAQTRDAALRIAGPLVTDAGDGRLIVGMEARILLDLLEDGYRRQTGGHWVLPETVARAAENQALQTYRSWTMRKLTEAIALQAGQGREALQATSVGLILALLINRADSPERAVMRPDEGAGHPVDEALHSAALAFADGITTGRTAAGKPRSPDERRLHGGYMLTEARRRLAGKMSGYPEAVYIQPGTAGEVIRFLAGELARRKNLTDSQLSDAFTRLVDAFRANARSLAMHNAIFESPAATRELREELLAAFTEVRKGQG